MKPFLSIIIPAYNEAERLPETLAIVRDWVEQQGYGIEVLVIDDGSTDATVSVVEEYAHRFPQLKLVKNKRNTGKGGAVRLGMLTATGEWRLFMDADASTPINQVERLLAHKDEAPVVIGSRYQDSTSIKIKQPFKRRVLSRVGNWLIQRMALPGFKDTQCGFKLFRADVAEKVFRRQHSKGWLFDVELLTIASELGYPIKEVPVDWYDAKQSKLRAARTGLRTFRELQQIRRRRKKGAYHHEPQE